jgi:ketosteroid isomerase-like protein
MRLQWISLFCVGLLSLVVAGSAQRVSNAGLQKQVTDTERAFAATMKARDHAAFTGFLSEDAVFFSAHCEVLRGKAAVAEAWKAWYIGPEAPFSWAPDQVEVVGSGTLAYSGGTVYDKQGRPVGRFNSIWRLEAPGVWKIVFDRGGEVRDCGKGGGDQAPADVVPAKVAAA